MSHIKINEVSLYVKTIGKGYPLLLMHGGPGADHSTLSSLSHLSENFTLIFYDHRCNGRSERTDVSTMTWKNLASDADALRQKLGFDTWVVLGHSFGGMVALEYALRFPQSLSHLILIDTCGDTCTVQNNSPQVLASRGFSSSTVNRAKLFFNGQVTSFEILTSMLKFGRAYYYKPKVYQLLLEFFKSLRIKRSSEAFKFGFSKLLKGWTVMNRLSEIKVPTLVLAGRHDFQFSPKHQKSLSNGIPNSQLEIIECAGHNAPMEKPIEVIKIINEFLSSKSKICV